VDAFVKLCGVDDVNEGQCKAFKIGNIEILVTKLEGQYFAVANRCTHLNFPLSEGRIEENRIICPGHGGQFDVKTGKVLSGPPKISLPIFEVKVEGEDLLIKLRR